MKKRLLYIEILLFGLIFFACKAQGPKIDYPEFKNVEGIESIVKPYLENKITKGLSIGIIQDGRIEFHNYGIHAADNTSTPTQQSIYEIGSISKTFTTTALTQMVEEGLVALEDPISKFLPEDVVNWKKELNISLRELATHQSGLPRLPDNLRATVKDESNPYANYTTDDLYDFLKSYNPIGKEKREISYSNLGMGLLGHILSLVEKKEYEDLIKERIFGKLSMGNSMIELDNTSKVLLVQGHNEKGEPTSVWDIPALAGAGAIRSNTEDMLKYLQEHLSNNLWAKTHAEQASFPDPKKIGLAWIISPAPNTDHTLVWHNGGTGGYRSFTGMIKEKKMGVIVLSNSTVSVDMIGVLILEYLTGK